MCKCSHCGQEVYRTHGLYSYKLGGWYCEDCFNQLRDDRVCGNCGEETNKLIFAGYSKDRGGYVCRECYQEMEE